MKDEGLHILRTPGNSVQPASFALRFWPRWTIARRLCAASFIGLLVLGHFDWFPHFAGSTTATRVGRFVPLVDPLAALEVTLATRHATWELVTGAGLLVSVAAVLGPVFCGWVCPMGLLLDVNQWLGNGIRRLLRRPPRHVPAWKSARAMRMAILGAVTSFSLAASIPLFQILSPINVIGWLAAITWTLGPGLILVAAIMLLEHVHPRLWCRALCPLGALYSLVGSMAPWRVRIRGAEEGKRHCRQCTLSCPMGIRVMEDYILKDRGAIDDAACTRCGTCIDTCPGGALSLGLSSRVSRNDTVAVQTSR